MAVGQQACLCYINYFERCEMSLDERQSSHQFTYLLENAAPSMRPRGVLLS